MSYSDRVKQEGVYILIPTPHVLGNDSQRIVARRPVVHPVSMSINAPAIRVLFSSVQDGIYALGKARVRFAQSLRSFPKVTFEADDDDDDDDDDVELRVLGCRLTC